MPKVLHVALATGGFDDAYGESAFTGVDEVWISFDVWFEAGLPTVDIQAAGQIGWSGNVGTDTDNAWVGLQRSSGVVKWQSGFGPLFSTITTGQWYRVEYHFVNGSPATVEFWVDGVEQGFTEIGSNADDFDRVGFGQKFVDTWQTSFELYIVNPRVGSTRLADDIWASDLDGASVPADVFDVVSVAVGQTFEVIEDPTGLAPDPPSDPNVGRVSIAMGSGPLDAEPTWIRVDNIDNLVARIEITSGKESEFDKTETGHYIVYVNDTDGLFDPSNISSPYFGCVGKQIRLQLFNPVDSQWYERARGRIEDLAFDLNPATNEGVSILSNVQIRCVGVFDYLARFQLIPGQHGDVAPEGSESNIFYEDGEVDDRLVQVLDDATINPSRYVVFSGNVNVTETLYDPGDTALIALRDAADAETASALANIYEDRFGRFVFHGRQARIDPDAVAADAGPDAWDFQRYKIGDGAAITDDPDYAQIRPPLQYRLSQRDIINSALVIPKDFDRSFITSLLFQDTASINDNGLHHVSYEDIINDGHKTNGDTPQQDTFRTAQYLVDNFKDPLIRIEALTVLAIDPNDPRAETTWNVLSRCDVSDRIQLKVGYPGSDGIDAEYNVEGFTQTISPLNAEHDMVDLRINVSPAVSSNPYDDNPS